MWRGMFVILISLGTVYGNENPKVKTEFGIHQGIWIESARGQYVASYLGIPYAKSPTGSRRFQKPVPWTKQWRKVRSAKNYAAPCISSWPDQEGSEDCLYLNIHTPQKMQYSRLEMNETGRAVLVYLIGDSFPNNNLLYSPIYLLDQNIVLVTVNYRLGIFGFFTTGDSAAPGNYGLKDVLEALRWIQRNIKAFGGDPDNVTLMGHAWAAGVAHLLALSEKSEGLFHKYVTQSGAALIPFSYRPIDYAVNISLTSASLVNCTQDTSEMIVNCMRRITAGSTDSYAELSTMENMAFTFGPVDEPESDEAVITEHPKKLIEEGKIRDIPWLTGVVADEGLMVSVRYYQNISRCAILAEQLDTAILAYTNYDQGVDDFTAFIEELAMFYFAGNFTNDDCPDNFAELMGDIMINWPVYETLTSQANTMESDVYFYNFAYQGTFTRTFGIDPDHRYGVSQGDEINYFFPVLNEMYGTLQLQNTEDDIAMINILTERWANFAKTGIPSARRSPEWKPYQDGHGYMNFKNEAKMSMQEDFLPDRMAFWHNLTEKYVPQPYVMAEEESKGAATSVWGDDENLQIFKNLLSLLVQLIISSIFFR